MEFGPKGTKGLYLEGLDQDPDEVRQAELVRNSSTDKYRNLTSKELLEQLRVTRDELLNQRENA